MANDGIINLAEHRRARDAKALDLAATVEDLLAWVRAGHADGLVVAVRHTAEHPTGEGWTTAVAGRVSFIEALGAAEQVKADVIRKANG